MSFLLGENMQIQISSPKQKPRKLHSHVLCLATGRFHRWILAGEILAEADLFELQVSPSEEICKDCWGRKVDYEVIEK